MDQIDQMESNGLHSTKPCQMVSCCLSTQVVKQVSRMDQIEQVSRMDQIDQMPSQMVKWSNGVLLHQHSGFKASESNGSNRSNGVEWTPFD